MTAPKDDSLTNRTLFNHDPTQLFTNKKQTDYSPNQQLEMEKEFGKEQSVNSRDTKDTPNSAIRKFFYFKELITDWLTELSVRPTQVSIIVTVTLYLVAISSTIQRRDGDRWLKSLLNAKLPGYTTLYQDTSWETFRSYTLKCLRENQNLDLSLSFRQDKTKDQKTYGLKQTQRNSFTAEESNGSAAFDETGFHLTALKEQEERAQGVKRENFQFLNSPLGRGDRLGFEKRQFVDLYKDKALIHLRSPWEKGIRKDFVAFFVKRQFQPATQTTYNTSESANHIVLPWYRIDACNRPDRVVLAAPKEQEKSKSLKEWKTSSGDLKEQKSNVDVYDQNKGNYLRDRREQSVLCLHEDRKRFMFAQGANTTDATDLKKAPAVSPYSIKKRIFGLEYIFPFQTSKGRVYAQSDSIPFKLESAYSLPDLLNNNVSTPDSIESSIKDRTALTAHTASFSAARSQLRKTKNDLFTKNRELFFGKNFYCFQKRLRELFYWYGLFPPYNLMELIDQKPSQSPQADKHNLKNEIHKDNLEESLKLDQTAETVGEGLLPQTEKETRAENSLQRGASTDAAIEDFWHKDQDTKELFYDNLTELVSRELAQRWKVPSGTVSLKSNCDKRDAQDGVDLLTPTPQLDKNVAYSGFTELFSRDSFFSLPKEEKKLSPQAGALSNPDQSKKKGAVNAQKPGINSINTLGDMGDDLDTLNRLSTENTLSQTHRFNSSIKQQIDNLIDRFAEQSDNRTDLDQLTCFEEDVEKKASLSMPGACNASIPVSTGNPIVVGEIGPKRQEQELQQIFALFAFKNWPLLANVNGFAQQDGALLNRFERSDAILTRLMSGYKFPDCTKDETDRLFREFVLPQLLVAGSVSFSHSYLINQTLLRPLYIKLPPALPFSFFEKLALSLSPILPSPAHRGPEALRRTPQCVHTPHINAGVEAPPHTVAPNETPKHSNINIEYKRISLQELREVKDVFVKLKKDYEDYLSLPKDSPAAIRISPSLDDDRALKLKAEQKEKRDEERVTAFERLQKIREREERFELGKELRPFAYKSQFAFQRPTADKMPCIENSIFGNNTASKMQNEGSHPFPAQDIKSPLFTEQENSWINFRLGRQNLLSDRKYSFFGRKHLLTKRLVAQEQKEIDEQISKDSYCAAGISLLGAKEGTASTPLSTNPRLTKNGDSNSLIGEQARRLFSNKKLQKRARKGLIRLLGSPDLSAHHVKGSLNRTRKANRALRGRAIKSAYSHLRWQKKRFRSRMLGTPCKRHLVMPEIASTDWKKMLEWQLKNYFFLEEKRLEPLRREEPEKDFKVKRLHIYLPWVTIRTPSDKPFQWPYTRLDCAECIVPAHIPNGLYELPEYKPVYYWDSGKSVSLSLPASKFSTGGLQKLEQNRSATFTRAKGGLTSNLSASRGSAAHPSGIRTRAVEEPYLCEPLTNQSWLLIYRLFLAFALQHLLKYVYRVSLKGFIVEMANSDFGLRVTSPKFREWLEHAQPKPFYTPKKRLRDVAAIEESIPILSEIVWYLRNFGRARTASRGFLLVGPAGAEKTSVVQAIAGECRVPVVVQSISALALTNEDPYEQLENAFTLARQQAPCVLFLDDLDFVGQSRADVVKNNIGPADLLFSLDTYTAEGKLGLANLSNSLHTHLLPRGGGRGGERDLDWQFNPLAANPVAQANIELEAEQQQANGRAAKGQGGGALATLQQNQESQTRRLNLLLRLLTEMDGVAPLNGVVILATSEQPALLDPALLRAGRFERRIHLSLPNKERRIQLFKAGTQKIGCMQSIPWDYLGTRTTNMSGIDIASAINHSAIRAIIDNTVHTVDSLEHGLNCVKGLPNKDSTVPVLQRSDPFHYSRLAFYQAGKAVVHNLLLDHPELGFCSLNQNHISGAGDITQESLQVLVSNEISPTTVSSRSGLRSRSPLKKGCASLSVAGKGVLKSDPSPKVKQDSSMQSKRSKLNSNVQSHKSGTTLSARTRIQFETRLVGMYAGKAAELLHLSSNVVSHCADQAEVRRSSLKRYQRFGSTSASAPRRDFRSSVDESTSKFGGQESTSLESSLALSIKRLADLSGAWKRPVHKQRGERGEVKPGLVSSHLKMSKTSGWLWQSNLGFSELLTASSLIHLMIDRWYLYSQKIFTYKINRVMPSLNHEQIKKETLFPLAKRLSQELEHDLIKPNFWGLTSYTSQTALPAQSSKQEKSTDELYRNKQIYQERIRTDWWQAKICQALEMRERPYGKWYRIYLPKIEEREQNKEWVPPDTIFHQSLTLSNLTRKTFKEKSKLATRTQTRHRFRGPSSSRQGVRDTQIRDLAARTRTPRTHFGKTRPSTAAGPEKRAFVEKSLTPANLLQRPLWQGKRSASSNAREITRETGFKQMSSSNNVRSLRSIRLNLDSSKQGASSLKTLNDLYLFERDSAHQKAVMNCFYTAFSLLNENRELLDLFADHLIRFKMLRSHEISKICSLFSPSSK